MSRTSLSQPQPQPQPQRAKRREGEATAALLRRFCSKGNVAVRNSFELLG